MKSKRWLFLAVALLGFVGMGIYLPRLRMERVYVVVPVQYAGNPVVFMGRTDDLREVRTESVGYGWVWSYPAESTFFGAEIEFSINWERLLIQAWAWTWVVVFLMMLYFRSSRPIPSQQVFE